MDNAIPNLEQQLLAAISMIPKAEPAIKTNVGAFVSTKMVLPIMIVAVDNSMNEDNIILGIDPGTTIMGFGIIKATSKEMSLIQMNELQLKKYEKSFFKASKIFERTQEIIDEFHPDEIAIEAPFFGKNVQSMLSWEERKALQWLLDYQGK